ncbi:hypothetical protein ILUMI_05586 [Ignelater luminosus]|uniref:Reverse transcriptase domain-containing protein n=1 Tax=Ignelater luminosus TaxID=2038154 RepID=A0A8K0GII9_IGNLU|nr:hypothetical protein ILUMI_05586 [Ignelater luminosus]
MSAVPVQRERREGKGKPTKRSDKEDGEERRPNPEERNHNAYSRYDPSIDERELITEIQKARPGIKEEDVVIRFLRPMVNGNQAATVSSFNTSGLFNCPLPGLSKATVPVTVNEFIASALIDTNRTASFINEQLAKDLKIRIKPCKEVILMASTTFQSSVLGQCSVSIEILDAYPLPNMEEIINDVANYTVFSTIDLKNAFHQIYRTKDRQYTAFEAGGQLFQFKPILFGVTNGVAGFQRKINYIIRQENLEGIFYYLDDVTSLGKNLEEHNRNLNKFLEAIRKYNITINFEKSIPDPERPTALKPLKPLTGGSSLKRVLRMFSHYSNFIHKFLDKIEPIIATEEESTVSTRDLASLPSIDENRSDPTEIPSLSHEQDGQILLYLKTVQLLLLGQFDETKEDISGYLLRLKHYLKVNDVESAHRVSVLLATVDPELVSLLQDLYSSIEVDEKT